jgi:DNA damage-inducible protein 1
MILSCCFGDRTEILNAPQDADFDMLKQLLAAEFAIPMNEFAISLNGKDLAAVSGSTTLVDMCMKDNDIIMLTKKEKRLTIQDVRMDMPPGEIVKLVRANPHLQVQFNNADPELGAAIETGDEKILGRLIMSRMMQHNKQNFEKEQALRRIEANPDSEENQKAMMERIRLENIQQNMETAMENMPEAFGRVIMLYVELEINNMPIKAFVDSGAQSTIMSVDCATRCGLMRLVDTRFAGEARGVGTAKILGRVHIAQMKLGNTFFPISITVLEKNDVDFLFGLDMLKRYRCQIDLSENCLRIDGGREAAPFLPENALPTHARGTLPEELAAQEQRNRELASSGTKAAANPDRSSQIVHAAPRRSGLEPSRRGCRFGSLIVTDTTNGPVALIYRQRRRKGNSMYCQS